MKSAILALAISVLSVTAMAEDIMPSEKRKTISLSSANNGNIITVNDGMKVFYTHIGENQDTSFLIYSQQIPSNTPSKEVYGATLKILQSFIKKYRVSSLDTPNLGIAFLTTEGGMHNSVAVLKHSDLEKMASRDWGEGDLSKPEGKFPYRELIKLIQPYNSNRVPEPSNSTALTTAASSFDNYSIFESFIEKSYYAESSANPSDSVSAEYSGCPIRFDSKDTKISWNLSHITLGLKGAQNSKESIYASLCKFSNGQSVTIGATTNEAAGTFKKQTNGTEHALVEIGGCQFDYYFGIVGDSFVTDHNQAQRCKTSRSQSATVRSIEMQEPKASKGGSQYYSVSCSNGASGIVFETEIGNSYGSICQSNSNNSSSGCVPKESSSIKAAASKLCRQ